MEAVRFAVAVFFVFFAVSSSNAEPTPSMGGGGGGGGGGDAHSMPCIQKLMPCQPYLHSVTPPPPASCCLPLKEIVEKDATCLCSVFNNVDMLKSLNLTKENALVLPKACGAKADISLCKTSTGTTTPSTSTSPATTTTPPASSTETGSTGASSSSTAKPTNSAPAINFAGASFASAFTALATIFF